MIDVMVLQTPKQLQGIAHPLRQRILRLLAERQLTNQQIAAVLNTSPAKTHFHVRVLLETGLIALADERRKGGVVEKYYRAVAATFQVAPDLSPSVLDGGGVAATLQTPADDIAANRSPRNAPPAGTRVVQLTAHVNAEGHARIQAMLDALEQEVAATDLGIDGPAERTITLTYALVPLPGVAGQPP
jgi:DNA-binding transcriptional ArsR family regulator